MFGSIRNLPFPLKNPVTSDGIVGSDDNESPSPSLAWITSDPDERVTVELELSLNEYVALSSTVDVGRDIAYGTQSQYIWWLWTRAFIRSYTGDEITVLEPTTEIQFINVPIPVLVMLNEEVDDMLKIELIDGKPYLEEDCGCGVRKYYTLTGASVNPNTGAISDIIDTVPSYIDNVPLTEEQISSCYAGKVADVVIDALEQFTDAIFNYALLGAAAFAPVATTALLGAVEIQQSIVSALNGDLTLNLAGLGYTASEVKAVFNSALFRQFIVDRLGSTQQIARWHLGLVSIRLTNRSDLNFPTPTSPVFNAWVAMVNLSALNQALQIAATQCSTGAWLPDYPTGEYDVWIDFRTVNPYPATVAYPDNNAQWFTGEGVGSVPENDNKEGYCQISHAMGATLNGVVVYLTAPLQGDFNRVNLGTTQWGNEIAETIDPSGLIHVIELDSLVVSPTLHYYIREWTVQTGDQTMTARVKGVRYIGNGTPPTGTTAYSGELE